MIKDLKARLKNHHQLVPPLENVGFEYGFNTKQIDPWVKYWAEQYNFTERERFFNKFPQFKTNIQGLDIHFIRYKPQVCCIYFFQFPAVSLTWQDKQSEPGNL